MSTHATDNLARALARNNQALAANNEARIRALRRYGTEGFAQVFDQVPWLLNVNRPDQPGFVDDPQTPSGLKYIDRQLWLTPENQRPAGGEPGPDSAARQQPVVESLFLIGSSGSVGHNASSDLDYWVCHEDGALQGRPRELFKRKLEAISRWAREEHQTEANFYLVNLSDLRQGRLTRLDREETEGEVAPLLLLEEFYRTCLFVAGRHPLWPVLPLDITEEEYRRLSPALADGPDAEYVDLGFPELPPPQEVLAAALWLARKSEADPFKGLLKIVVLLDYVESDLQREPLCHQIKGAILASSAEELPVDPYTMTVNRVMEYGKVHLSPDQLDLLRMASALKVIGGGDGGGQPAFFVPYNSPKRVLLSRWAREWDWSRDRIVHLVNYSSWPEREQLYFGGELMNMLTSVYIRIAQYLIKEFPGQINPQDDELAPLAARLLARIGGLDCTVESLPSQIHYHSISSRLVLEYDPSDLLWRLHGAGANGRPSEHNLIYGCPRAAKAAAWLVHNRLYGPDKSLVINNPLTRSPSPEDFRELLELLGRAFPFFELRHCDLDNLWSPGGQGKIVLALNFELPPESRPELATADIITRTGWGEMRHYLVRTDANASLADKYLRIIQTILKEFGHKINPERLLFLEPKTPEQRKAMMNIKGGLAAAAKRKRGGPGKSRIDIAK